MFDKAHRASLVSCLGEQGQEELGRVIGCDAAVMTRPIDWWAHQRVGTGPHACWTVSGSSTSDVSHPHQLSLGSAAGRSRVSNGRGSWHTRNRSFRNTIATARERESSAAAAAHFSTAVTRRDSVNADPDVQGEP